MPALKKAFDIPLQPVSPTRVDPFDTRDEVSTPSTPGAPTSSAALSEFSQPSALSSRQALNDDLRSENEIAALPDPDTGYAWVYLGASFMVETLAFGFTFSVGVFHSFWTTTLFPGNPFVLTLVATMQSGLIYIAALAISPFYTRYPEYRAQLQYGGQAISTLGILLSGFATQPWHLIPTAGVMYPIGASAVYLPATTLLFDWFQRKRGLANGVMYSGTGLGGAILPLIMEALLSRFSYKAAVVSLALGCGFLGMVSIYFIKERVPVARYSGSRPDQRRRKIPLDFFRRSAFWAFAATVATTSFTAFLPTIYVPEYSTAIGLSHNTGTLMLVTMNLSSIFGQLLQGYMSDRLPLKVVVFASCMGASLSAFFFFGFATNLALLAVFCIAWGFTALGSTASWVRQITVISKDDPVSPPTIFGIMFLTRGVCTVIAGPISSFLLQGAALPDARFGYGVKNYGGLLIFIGCMNAIGSITCLCWKD